MSVEEKQIDTAEITMGNFGGQFNYHLLKGV